MSAAIFLAGDLCAVARARALKRVSGNSSPAAAHQRENGDLLALLTRPLLCGEMATILRGDTPSAKPESLGGETRIVAVQMLGGEAAARKPVVAEEA